MPNRSIVEVLDEHTPELMTLSGVVGTYLSETDDGTPCIKVMVIQSTPELEESIPKQLEGYPVVIEVTGEIRGLAGEDSGD